jgi:putative DNA primase/helicase
MSETTAQAAHGNWEFIFEKYGMPPKTGGKHYDGECPICKGKGKFRFDDKRGDGGWICNCNSGAGFKLLELATGKDFKTLAAEIDKLLGRTYQTDQRQPTQKMNKVKQARDKFLSLPAIKGTQAQEYLNARGIYSLPTRGIRYSEAELDSATGRKFGAIFSVASDEYGEPVYIHRTYLDGADKAKIEAPRKLFSLKEFEGPAAVKMFAVAEVMGISEGIETGLSAYALYKMPVWSTINTSIMRKFRAPTGVKTLYIFADNDKNGAGLAAAFECGHRNVLTNNDVTAVVIRWPQDYGKDFNDVLVSGGQVIEWRLGKTI